MKTTKFLTIAFAALFLSAAFVACDKDDDNNQKEETVVPGNSDEKTDEENAGNSGENAETPDNNGDSENGNTGNENSGEENNGNNTETPDNNGSENTGNSEGSTETTAPTKGIENGHEWVDLGLSVRWATCNIGAEKPEEYGDFFAWGEIETKNSFDDILYRFGLYQHLTKYCYDEFYGKIDDLTVLEPEDDAAHMKWKGKWRMPTLEEMRELQVSCLGEAKTTWEWTTINGKNGFKVTNNTNDNSIFLPAAGGLAFKTDERYNIAGNYWTSTLELNGFPTLARAFVFTILGRDCTNTERWVGLTIRPVCPK